ncbi:MAG: hypothetical protein ACFCVK_07950 [Acidimicrobiales bacterium]
MTDDSAADGDRPETDATTEITIGEVVIDRRHALITDPRSRRRAGRVMVGTAIVGVAIILVGTVVVWSLLGDVNRATTGTLDVTVEALESMEATIDLADDLIGSTTDSLAAVEDTLTTVSESFESGNATLADVAELTATAEPTLRNTEATLRQLEGLGSQIDGALEGLSAIPFGPDYDPEDGLGPTFGRLADDLAPLPDEFADTSTGLVELQTTLTELQGDVDVLVANVHALNEDLADSTALIEQYRDNVSQARDLAEQSRRDLDRDHTWLRIILLVAAANFTLAQLVPLWFGWELLTGPGSRGAGEPDPLRDDNAAGEAVTPVVSAGGSPLRYQ